MAIRFQRWYILEALGLTEKDHEIWEELNQLLFSYACQRKFYPTRKEILSNISVEKRKRAGIVLDAFADVQLVERVYREMRDKDGEYNRNTPCYNLYTAAELEEIHGWCSNEEADEISKELKTDD